MKHLPALRVAILHPAVTKIAGLRQRSMSDNRKPTAEVVYDRERGSTVPLKSVVSESSLGMNPIGGTIAAAKQFGWKDVWAQMRQCKDAKVGTLVGTDALGNRYYENKNEQFGRDRWVVYNTKDIHMDYDPALVPAEWHGWLHHSTDSTPADLIATHGDVLYAKAPQTFSKEKMTGRDVNYNNPGKLVGGKVRGDGYTSKSGSVRPPFQRWDPNAEMAA